MKLLRKTEMLPKTEKGKGLLFCFIQYPEVQKNINKKKIHYMKLHQTVKASAQGRKQLTQNKKQPSK